MTRPDIVSLLAQLFAVLPDATPPFAVCRFCGALTVETGCAAGHEPTTPTDEEIEAAREQAKSSK